MRTERAVNQMALYDFGSFQLDEESRLLLHRSEPVPLTAKVFDTLTVLVKNHGHALNKQQLFAAIWPDTVVEEANLTQNISTLRKALGDTAKDHRLIATIPGRGYSFVAPVVERPKAAVQTVPKDNASDGQQPRETSFPLPAGRVRRSFESVRLPPAGVHTFGHGFVDLVGVLDFRD